MLYKNALLNIVSMVVSTVCLGASLAMSSRILGPTKMGEYTYALWMINVALLIATGGIPLALAKFIPELKKKVGVEGIQIFFLRAFLITLFSSILISLFLAFLFPLFKQAHSYLQYLELIAIAVPFATLTLVFTSYLRGLERFDRIAKITILGGLLSAVAIILASFLYKSVNAVLIGYIISLAVILLIFTYESREVFGQWRNLLQPIQINNREILQYVLSVSLIIILDTIVWDKSEVYFLKRFTQDQQVAYYSLAYMIVSKVTSLIPSALSFVLVPVYSSFMHENDKASQNIIFYKSTKYLALFVIPLSIEGIVFAAPIINFLLGSQYIGGIGTLRVMFLFCVFGVIAMSGASLLYSMKKQNVLLLNGIIFAALSLLFDFLVIPRYSSIGAAFVNGGIQCFGILFSTWYTIRKFKLDYPFRTIVKAYAAALIGIGIFFYPGKYFNNIFLYLLFSILGLLGYALLLFLFHTFSQDDFELLYKLLSCIPFIDHESVKNLLSKYLLR